MDHQATLNGNASTGRDFRHHVAGMVRDLTRIADLQARLLSFELRQARARLSCAASCWMTALMLSITVLPIAVAGGGLWLADVTELSAAGGLLCAAGAGGVLALLLAIVGWVQMRRQWALWQRAKEELGENMHAVGAALSSFTAHETELS